MIRMKSVQKEKRFDTNSEIVLQFDMFVWFVAGYDSSNLRRNFVSSDAFKKETLILIFRRFYWISLLAFESYIFVVSTYEKSDKFDVFRMLKITTKCPLKRTHDLEILFFSFIRNLYQINGNSILSLCSTFFFVPLLSDTGIIHLVRFPKQMILLKFYAN